MLTDDIIDGHSFLQELRLDTCWDTCRWFRQLRHLQMRQLTLSLRYSAPPLWSHLGSGAWNSPNAVIECLSNASSPDECVPAAEPTLSLV